MGKAKKLKVSRSSTDKGLSLTDQVMSDDTVKQSGRIKVRKRKDEDEEVSGNWGSLISSTVVRYPNCAAGDIALHVCIW